MDNHFPERINKTRGDKPRVLLAHPGKARRNFVQLIVAENRRSDNAHGNKPCSLFDERVYNKRAVIGFWAEPPFICEVGRCFSIVCRLPN